MKAILFYGPKDLRIENVPDPTISKGEVLVEIKAALTGGTDTKTYLQGHPKLIKSIPSSFGYEFSGIVKETKNSKFSVGDKVVAANTAPCYKCFFCKKEEFELCENLEFFNGSFAELIKIPETIVENNLYKIPESLDFKTAAAVQTLAVTLHGFEKSGIKDNDIVCVYGIGAIGLSFIKLCRKLRKNITIIAIGNSALKTKFAKANGADFIFDYKDPEFTNKIKAINGYGADVVFEAVGKPEAWLDCLKMVRAGGLINFFGGCKKDSKVVFDTYQIHYQEIRMIGTFHHRPKYIQQALELLASGAIDMSDLITAEFKLEDLEIALQQMIEGKILKAVIASPTQ